LFLAHLLPWPLAGGGQIKSYHTLRILSRRYDVTLLAFVRRPDELDGEGEAALRPLCAAGDVRTVLIPRSRGRDVRAAARALASRSRSFIVGRDDVPAMHQAVRQVLVEKPFDVIHVDHLQMAQFVPPDLPRSTTRVVLDHHNLEHRIPQRLVATPGANALVRWYAGREWPKLRDWEIGACRRSDRVLVVSDEDRDGLRALAPDLAGSLGRVSHRRGHGLFWSDRAATRRQQHPAFHRDDALAAQRGLDAVLLRRNLAAHQGARVRRAAQHRGRAADGRGARPGRARPPLP
jgi:hypothetical protein